MGAPSGREMRNVRRGARTARFASLAGALALVAGVVVVVTSGRASGHHGREPETAARLRADATAFNADYASGRDAAAYAYFDAASRRVISESAYVRRHRLCPDPPGQSTILGATRIGRGWWTVTYRISGTDLVDYWVYHDGRFEFDLPRSNPSAVALYEEPFAQYARALGCGA